MPAMSREECGAMKGKGVQSDRTPFDKNTTTTYRKIAANREKLDDFYAATEEISEVPTQTDFLRYVANGQQRDAEERAERLKHESQRQDDLSRMSDQELEEYTNDVHRTLLRKHPQIAVGPLRALGWTVEPPAVN